MYSNKENVNILTSLLIKHGVKHAVLCPGSRNAPLTHNLQECGAMTCHSIVDERSAAFFALGIILATGQPAAVCVTSGSALLNTASAASEAFYQHLPLIIISADRPLAWLDQMDGQTIKQHGVLNDYVKKSVSLPEPHDEETRWHCNRLVNEALLALSHHGRGPVHINVHISEPLYQFTTATLPDERIIRRLSTPSCTAESIRPLLDVFAKAKRPMIVIGQMPHPITPVTTIKSPLIISESLAYSGGYCDIEGIIDRIDSDTLPDLIIYMGGMIVNKRLKQFLRKIDNAEQWRIDPSGDIADTFCHLAGIIEAEPEEVLRILIQHPSEDIALSSVIAANPSDDSTLSLEEYTVKYLELKAASIDEAIHFHYANSTSIRLANKYARHHVFCNRGVNGIDGSLSTAAGHSAVVNGKVVCVIGDLSFFYDANALWNCSLHCNFRILLINNGTGAIFRGLPGFSDSSASAAFIAGSHTATAKGICESYNVEYLSACNKKEIQNGIDSLLTMDSNRPILLEVLINKE